MRCRRKAPSRAQSLAPGVLGCPESALRPMQLGRSPLPNPSLSLYRIPNARQPTAGQAAFKPAIVAYLLLQRCVAHPRRVARVSDAQGEAIVRPSVALDMPGRNGSPIALMCPLCKARGEDLGLLVARPPKHLDRPAVPLAGTRLTTIRAHRSKGAGRSRVSGSDCLVGERLSGPAVSCQRGSAFSADRRFRRQQHHRPAAARAHPSQSTSCSLAAMAGKDAPGLSVLFIGGHSRSGSTLLSRLLGHRPSMVSVGELTFIGSRGHRDNQLCGCGTPFRECPFWVEVTEQACGPKPDDWFSRFEHLRSRLDRIRYVPLLAAHSNTHRAPQAFAARCAEYTEMLSSLLCAIGKTANADVIIDSSKEPPHGFLLNECDGIRLFPLHLVRDSRAVAYSQQRVRVRPEIHWTTEHMPRFSPNRSAADWVQNNLLMHLLGRISGRYFRLKYEDIVSDPEATVTGLLEQITPGVKPIGPSPLSSISEHELSGNPMRFKRDFKISLDVEWLAKMPMRDKLTTTAISAPLLLAYNYPLTSPIIQRQSS